jgi:hypothetical protein
VNGARSGDGGTDGRMRELFRGLRNPQAAERDALTASLLDGPDHDGLRAALLAFVETTLRDYDPRYRDIVVRADIEGKPGKQVAHELALAQRTYYRLRAVAMRALDRALEVRLQRSEDEAANAPSGDPHAVLLEVVAALDPARAHAIVEQLGPATSEQRFTALRLRVLAGEVPADDEIARLGGAHRFAGDVLRARAFESGGLFDAAETLVATLEADPARDRPEHRIAAFDLAMVRRLQARRHGDGVEHAAAVDDMVARAAGVPVLQPHAAIAYAHVGIHLIVSDWLRRLEIAKQVVRLTPQVAMLRYATMVEGYLAYVHGDFELALHRSHISTLEGANPSVALQGEALYARAALALGRPWQRPPWTRSVLPNAWFQAELEALGAHHALANGDSARARRLAEIALTHASTPYAPCVGALAGAVSAVLRGERADAVLEPDDVLTHVDLQTLQTVVEQGRPPRQPPSPNSDPARPLST